MSDLLSKTFINTIPYFNSKNLSIPDSLKVIDIILLSLEVNREDKEELNSYIDSFIQLNNLLKEFFTFNEKESTIFDNSKIIRIKTSPKYDSLLSIFIEKRIEIYEKYEPNLFSLVQDLRGEDSKAA